MNRESAYEILSKRTAGSATPAPRERAIREPSRAHAPRRQAPSRGPAARAQTTPPQETGGVGGAIGDLLWGTKRRQGMVEAMAKQAARTVGSEVGRQILRGVLGGILGGSRRR